MKAKPTLIALLLGFASSVVIYADEQVELRLNPEISADTITSGVDLSQYPFIDPALNTISLNGDDWSALAAKFAAAARCDSLFSIVYLGDSHVQADFNVSTFRQIIQNASHPAGRGLVIPFKLAKTNEPIDYDIRLDSPYESSKLLKTPWTVEMPFSGIGLSPKSNEYTVDISCDTPFSRLRFFHCGAMPELISFGGVASDPVTDGEGWIMLSENVNRVSAGFSTITPPVIGGVELLSDTVGTVVHSIGNNGATYFSYCKLSANFEHGIGALAPDLVIIALGTNEAFSRISRESMTESIDGLISAVRRGAPSAKILLVSPTECYKKVYRRSGKKRRRTSTMVTNTKIADIAAAISDYARANGIALYDRFTLAGGAGAAKQLKSKAIIGRDGIHCTVGGYRLWGSLLGEAVLSELEHPAPLLVADAPEENNFSEP